MIAAISTIRSIWHVAVLRADGALAMVGDCGDDWKQVFRAHSVGQLFIEQPRLRSAQGLLRRSDSTAPYELGLRLGRLEGVAEALGVAVFIVPPEQWRRAAGLAPNADPRPRAEVVFQRTFTNQSEASAVLLGAVQLGLADGRLAA